MDDNMNTQSNRFALISIPPVGAPFFVEYDDGHDSLDSRIDHHVLAGPQPSLPPPSSPLSSSPPPFDFDSDDDTAENYTPLNLTPNHISDPTLNDHQRRDPPLRQALTELQVSFLCRLETKSPCDVVIIDFKYCTGSSIPLSFALGRLDGVLLGHWHIDYDGTAVQDRLARIDKTELDRFDNAQIVHRSTVGQILRDLHLGIPGRDLNAAYLMKRSSLQPPIITPMGNNEPALPATTPTSRPEPTPTTTVPMVDDGPSRDVWILSYSNSIRQLKLLSLLIEGADPLPQHLKDHREEDEFFLRHESLRGILKALLPVTSAKLSSVYTDFTP